MQAYYAYLAKRLSALLRWNDFPQRPVGGGRPRVNEEEMRKRLEMLKIEHRDLDAAIDALTSAGASDQIQIARLKKRKLNLKDQIALIADYLIPDIIA
jgi:hypothetical protein